MDFSLLRNNLLNEAKSSPNLLSDLAGLESYIAESYNNRSFIELLQNADDAKSSKFKIIKDRDYLLVANNGRIFNIQDLENLCRSASSNKVRGKNIGYRGIGFKSVVGFAKEIHIISGEMEITFSKLKTKAEVSYAKKVPLVRIPHPLNAEIKKEVKSSIDQLFLEKFTTIFIFSGVTARAIELEFEMFETSSLLFLQNIIETEVKIIKSEKTTVIKERISETETILNIKSFKNNSSWLIVNENSSSIAFFLENNIAKKLDNSSGTIYAFLPTENTCGLGVLINGDFSTDPSRKHLIFDEITLTAIKHCCNHILKVIKDNLGKDGRIDIINALIPHTDPRMLQFKKSSFEKILLEYMANHEYRSFKELKLCPSWLNVKDYVNLLGKAEEFNYKILELDGFIAFAKYLGAVESSFSDFKDSINLVQISILGCVQIVIHIFKGLISGSLEFNKDIANLKIFIVNMNRISLAEIIKDDACIDKSFISLLIENGLTEFDIKQVLNKYIFNDYCERLFTKSETIVELETLNENKSFIHDWFKESSKKSYLPTKSTAKKWRSVEKNTLEVLNSNGFKLVDVSKQNIGYDLEGITPEGNEIQIEVKSIETIGEKFRLTNNEVAVAQEKQETYFIAIVRQLENFIEIALIPDPIKSLTLNRQCVRWIWECSSYEYKPIRFEI